MPLYDGNAINKPTRVIYIHHRQYSEQVRNHKHMYFYNVQIERFFIIAQVSYENAQLLGTRSYHVTTRTHRTTESNTLHGYVNPLMDIERVNYDCYIWNAVLI